MCMGTGNGHFVERESSTQRKADITEGVVQIRPGVQTHLCQRPLKSQPIEDEKEMDKIRILL